MLVHPEVQEWLNRQTRTERKKDKSRPLIMREGEISRSDQEKARENGEYEESKEAREHGDDVEYLNERKSSLSFYA
jgi:hypothetical protein